MNTPPMEGHRRKRKYVGVESRDSIPKP